MIPGVFLVDMAKHREVPWRDTNQPKENTMNPVQVIAYAFLFWVFVGVTALIVLSL